MKDMVWLLKLKLFFLVHRYNGIVEYNLSGSGWQDYYSSSERSRMYSVADDNRRLKDDLAYEITLTVRDLVNKGVPLEELTDNETVKIIISDDFYLKENNENIKTK